MPKWRIEDLPISVDGIWPPRAAHSPTRIFNRLLNLARWTQPFPNRLTRVWNGVCGGRRAVAKTKCHKANQSRLSYRRRVQPPYYGVDNIDAVDKFTPGFVTR